MTREQFVNGVSFYLPNELLRTENTYIYKDQMILKEERTLEGRHLFTRYEAWVEKVGKVGFTAIRYVLDKRVSVKFRFEDLKEVK